MARPMKKRRICAMPSVTLFAPSGETVPKAQVEMTVDEYETIRLIDYLRLSQEECSKQMNVARTTVQAIYDSARSKVAQSLVEGKSLHIQGGSYDLCPMAQSCCGKNCIHRNCPDGEQPCSCNCSSGENKSCESY